MQTFLISSGLVALAEIGDKTQLLALVLAARYRKPVPIVLGIFVATLVNHALAGAVGAWMLHQFGPTVMRWAVGLSFLGMAGWMLVPDKLDDEETRFSERFGVFGATVVAFFLAEMGDKTQIATVALAARFPDYGWVIAGTTAGLMLADVPAVWIGDKMARTLPVALLHKVAAGLFVILGALALAGVGT